MSTEISLEKAGEVTTDKRRRISLSKFGNKAHDRYEVRVNSEGVIMLIPLASIPLADIASPEVVEMVKRAMNQPLSTYTEYRREDFE